MRKIFLDTSGILATVNKKDALHEKAVKINEELELEPVQFVFSDYILVEVCNALSRHKLLAIKTLEYLQSSDDMKVIKISRDILDKALEIYKKYSDKDWGLTDITSFLVMQQEDLKEAFTADHHFTQYGFKVLL